MDKHLDSINRACVAVGGQAAMARLIGVSPPTINQWIKGDRPVPAERCPAVERATRGVIRCEDLRPDVDWSVLRTPAKRKPAKVGA